MFKLAAASSEDSARHIVTDSCSELCYGAGNVSCMPFFQDHGGRDWNFLLIIIDTMRWLWSLKDKSCWLWFPAFYSRTTSRSKFSPIQPNMSTWALVQCQWICTNGLVQICPWFSDDKSYWHGATMRVTWMFLSEMSWQLLNALTWLVDTFVPPSGWIVGNVLLWLFLLVKIKMCLTCWFMTKYQENWIHPDRPQLCFC